MTSKKKKPEKKKEKEEKPETKEVHEDEEEGFGGLPERDLKKNLGCG